MDQTFYEIKRQLKKEFDELNEKYPLGKQVQCSLYVYPAEDEIDGFLSCDYQGKKIILDIVLFVDSKHQISSHDIRIMEKFKIAKGNEFYVWMLYHEFGHALDLKNTRKKSGFRVVKKKMKRNGQKIKKIQKKINENILTKKEGSILYRELALEKKADRFANFTYKQHRRKEYE